MKDIHRIESLLKKYYEGCTSPSEVAELRSLLESADELPAPLASEREIFLMMEAPVTEVKVPENLKDRLENALDDKVTAERNEVVVPQRHRRTGWRRLYYAGAAAALILVAVMGWRAMDVAGDKGVSEDTDSIVVLTLPAESALAESSRQVDSDKKNAVAGKGERRKSHPAAVSTAAESESNLVAKADVYEEISHGRRDITDPEEARIIMERVGSMLAMSLMTAETACDRPDMILESLSNTIGK